MSYAPEEIAGVLLASVFTGAFMYERHRRKVQGYNEELDEEDIDYDEYDEGEWPPPDTMPRRRFSEEPAYPQGIEAETPLATWRRTRMSNVTNIPATLLHNGAPVSVGDVLPYGGPGSGRQVKVLDVSPDENGGILVQENFRASPDGIGCEITPERVVVELTPQEARDFLKFASEQQKSQAARPAISDDTVQRSMPFIQDLKNTVNNG